MSKIFIIFLCLSTIFFGIPQTNKASAVDAAWCWNNQIYFDVQYTTAGSAQKYDSPPSDVRLSKETDNIYFKFTNGLAEGKNYKAYIERVQPNTLLNEGYSNEAQFKNGQMEISISKADKRNLFDETIIQSDTYYKVFLLEQDGAGGYDKTRPKCRVVDYRVGYRYKSSDCRMTLSDDKPAPYQEVAATISQSPAITWEISYRPRTLADQNSPLQVATDDRGNGQFVFKTGGTLLDNAKIALYYTIPNQGGGAPTTIEACTTNIRIINKEIPKSAECIIFPNSAILTTLDTDIMATAVNAAVGKLYRANLINKNIGMRTEFPTKIEAKNKGDVTFLLTQPNLGLSVGNYSAEIIKDEDGGIQCSKDFRVGEPLPQAPPAKQCKPGDQDCTSGGGLEIEGCSKDPNNPNPGIATAIGCIHTNPTEFTRDLLKFGVGIGGGLAFLMMLLGAFQMLTSAGNPETLNAGKERLTSAVIGLLFVIFSILLLKIIGVDILGLGGQFGYKP